MKKLVLGSLALGMMCACTSQPESIDVYLQKRVGIKRQYGSMMGFDRLDTLQLNQLCPEVKVAPEGLTEVAYYFGHTDFPQAFYQGYQQGKISKEDCQQMFKAWNMDTLDCSPEPLQVYVVAAIGKDANGVKNIVFDGNANMDFTDDEPMPYDNQHPVPLYHERYIDGRAVADTTYVYTVEQWGNLYLKAAEWVEQKITLKGKEYDFYIDNSGTKYDRNASLNFSTPYHKYTYRLGQYAVLSDSYYLIDSLSADGRYMHLTEVPDAPGKEAMQKGFRVCSFSTTDMEGNTVNFPDDFKGKYVLLDFWATTCGACVVDFKTRYVPLYEKYHDLGFEILGIADDSSDDILKFKEKYALPWITVADRDHNSELVKRFGITAFPTVYLIDPEGRVCGEGTEVRTYLEDLLGRYLGGYK